MIDLRLAMRLKLAGLVWHPAPGDRFAVPQPELLGQVFTVSEMTVDVHELSAGPVLGFNGTTEWALDSVQAADAVWLPAEHQLRALLGPAFRSLRLVGGGVRDAGGVGRGGTPPGGDVVPHGGDGFCVVAAVPGSGELAFDAPVAEDAYALALLAVIDRTTG